MIFAELASKHSEGWLGSIMDLEFWQKPSQIRTGNIGASKGDLILWPVVPSTSCIIHSLSPEPPIDKANNSTLLKLGDVSIEGSRVFWFLRAPSLYLEHDGTFYFSYLKDTEVRVPYWWVSETEEPSSVGME